MPKRNRGRMRRRSVQMKKIKRREKSAVEHDGLDSDIGDHVSLLLGTFERDAGATRFSVMSPEDAEQAQESIRERRRLLEKKLRMIVGLRQAALKS